VATLRRRGRATAWDWTCNSPTDHGIATANTAGATFTVSGAIDLNGHKLSVNATDLSGTTELDGPIGLNIGGNGQAVLTAANSYSGVTTINGGTLVVRNAQGIGATGTSNDTDVETSPRCRTLPGDPF
jgi:autotransporter-associated beta strand protein